jgi:hypothetical protein
MLAYELWRNNQELSISHDVAPFGKGITVL